MTLARHGHRFQPDTSGLEGRDRGQRAARGTNPPPGSPPERASRPPTEDGAVCSQKGKKALALDSGLKPFVFWANQPPGNQAWPVYYSRPRVLHFGGEGRLS